MQTPEPQRRALVKMPVYTPVLLGLAERNETALLVRVDDLWSFRKAGMPISVKFIAWRSERGTWVCCVAFRVAEKSEGPLEGDAYLNPRQAQDYELILRLTAQEIFPIFFLSADLGDAVGKRISWPDQQRAEVAQAPGWIDQDVTGAKLEGAFDPDFDRSKVAFQKTHALRDLLG